ncbi:MAG TPA: AraC family transcriptional regulator [Candidatus Baltobacteraceae bacterium]|jgi:AraC family transcriptional regulator
MRVRAILQPGAFYGETVSFEMSQTVLSEVRHYVGRTVPAHVHEAAYFSLLLEGAYRETADAITIAYDPFTFVFHKARTEHTDTIGVAGCRMFFIELLPAWIDTIAQLGSPPVHLFELHGGDAVWLALRLYHEFLAREAADPTTVESLVFELCGHVVRAGEVDEGEPHWLEAVDRALQAAFAERLDLRELASEAGVDPSHLCRVFRRFRGRSVGDYLVGMRMQRVCRRLVEGSATLSEIALETGFTDQSHLNHAFKRFIGESPGAYRRRLQAGFHPKETA